MVKKSTKAIVLAGLVILTLASWQFAAEGKRRRKRPEMPRATKAAIRKAFPKAKIVKFEAETHLLVIYKVELVQNGREFEAEAFVDGKILTVENKITQDDLPKAVAAALAKVADGAEIKKLDKKVIRAIIAISYHPRPKDTYEAEFVKNGKTIEVKFDAKGKILSRKVEDDDDDGENEREISLEDCPPAVRKTILKHAGKNKVREVEVETRRGRKVYEAEWRENGQEVEIKVAPDGRVISKTVEDDDNDDEEDDDEGEDEND